MTAGEAINKVDGVKYNSFSEQQKLLWLESLDKMVRETVLVLYKNAPEEHQSFTTSTELYVHSPFDEIYVSWLYAKIDLGNNEYEHYNNDAIIFDSQLSDFKSWMIRNNVPLRQARIKRICEV